MLQRFSAYFWYGVLAFLYLLLSLTLPVSRETLTRIHVNLSQYHLIIFMVLVPYILIWFAAFYAYIKMGEYTKLLGRAQESTAFGSIARGIKVMAWGLALPALFSTILKGIAAKNPGMVGPSIVLANYATLLVPLIAFTYIGNGARALSKFTKTRPSLNGFRVLMALFLTFAIYYTYLALYARKFHGNPYHLSLFPMMFTIIVPYLYAWFQGAYSCYEIFLYSQKVKGLLYKRALNMLTTGIATVIASSIFIQFITIVYAYKVNVSLGSLIVLVYMLLATEAIGFVLIANGAKGLKRIEEI